jgi:hypothetical protein
MIAAHMARASNDCCWNSAHKGIDLSRVRRVVAPCWVAFLDRSHRSCSRFVAGGRCSGGGIEKDNENDGTTMVQPRRADHPEGQSAPNSLDSGGGYELGPVPAGRSEPTPTPRQAYWEEPWIMSETFPSSVSVMVASLKRLSRCGSSSRSSRSPRSRLALDGAGGRTVIPTFVRLARFVRRPVLYYYVRDRALFLPRTSESCPPFGSQS